MDDSKISKKSGSRFKEMTRSLALRVFAVSFLLLIIPLFLQNLFLYRQEFQYRLADMKEILDVIGKEREASIEDFIDMEWQILDIVTADVNNHIEQLQLKQIPMPKGAQDHFAISNSRKNALLIGKKISSAYAVAIPVPFDQLIAEMEVENLPFPIRMALVDEKGTVFAENKPAESGPLLTVKETVPSADFNLLLTVPESSIAELQKKSYYYRLATLIFFIGVIGGIAVWWLTSRIAKPLKSLGKTMQRVSEGAVHVRYTPDRMGFEINELGKRFNETVDAVLLHSQEAQKERIEREKLAEEWRIGHDIQAGLFPKDLPGFPGIDLAAAFVPAKEVNGDFYDLFALDNGQLLIAMADTAGKGISACIYSLGLRSMLRSLASTTDDLSEIVLKANDLFWIDARNTSMFASLWVALYDPEKRLLTYCSQGHPPALLRRHQKIEELWTGGIALGAQKFDAVPKSEIQLEKGDSLLLYTDGIIEAHDPEDQLFGKERLHKFFLAKKKESAQQCVDRLLEEVKSFSGTAPQHDDMTLLILHISH